ncbi:MAG: hypothetical protein GXO70_08640 [Acidobacteria bacterium]|nr:hypothetical protein [Acidobacteriota bacterium]
MKKLLAVFVLGMLVTGMGFAQTLERIGEWGTPAYNRIVKVQNMAYMLAGTGWLDVVNVADPAQPDLVTRLHFDGKPKRLLLNGNVAYLAAGWSGIYVLDISTPEAPEITAHLDLNADTTCMGITGNYLYVGTRLQGIAILDISDPASPVLDHSYGVTEGTVQFVSSVTFDETYAYILDNKAGLYVVDVTDPLAPDALVRLSLGFSIQDAVLSGTTLVVAAGINGVQLLDVSDPTAPTLAGTFTSQSFDLDSDGITDVTYSISYVSQVFVQDTTLVAADGDKGFDILDISDPTAPALTVQNITSNRTEGAILEGNTLYLAETVGGLAIFDISDPTTPASTGGYQQAGYVSDVASSSGYLYLADAYQGIRSLNASNLTDLQEVGLTPTTTMPMEIEVKGNRLYSAALDSGLTVVDISDPTIPVEMASVPLDGMIFSLTPWNDDLIASSEFGGISVVSLDDPDNPIEIGHYLASGFVYDVAADGNQVALATGFSGVEFLSLDDPTHPALQGKLNTSGVVASVAVQGQTAYVADLFAGLYVVDISNPGSPQILAELPDETGISDLTIGDGILYVARGTQGMDKLDIHSAQVPVFVENVATFGSVSRVRLDLPYVYLADRDSGRVIVLKESPSTKLSIPHIASGSGWETGITLTNTAELDGTAVLTTYRDTVPILSTRLSIPASGSLTVNTLPGTCGTIEFWSPEMKASETIMATATENKVTIPLTQLKQHEVRIAVPDNADTTWTGLALMNGGKNNAELIVHALNADGVLLATKTVILGSNYRKAWLMSDLFGNINHKEIASVTVNSQEPVNGLCISGNIDGTMEAAVGRN